MREKRPRYVEDPSTEAIQSESTEIARVPETPENPPEKTEVPIEKPEDAHIEDVDAASFDEAVLYWELERNRIEAMRAEARAIVERIKHLTKQELEKLISNIERVLSSGRTIAEDDAVTIALLRFAAREVLKTK